MTPESPHHTAPGSAGHPPRSWDVLLLGGPSGTGKTEIAYPLARRYDLPVLEVDDLVAAILAVTSPDTHPDLHYWRTHPGSAAFAPERIVDLQIAMARALEPAVAAVVGNHLDTGVPVVIEGDYLLPDLAVRDSFAGVPAKGRVRSVFLYEPDARQIAAHYLSREPTNGDQLARAEVSVRFGDWLAAGAARHGIPVLAPRPWSDAVDRVSALLG